MRTSSALTARWYRCKPPYLDIKKHLMMVAPSAAALRVDSDVFAVESVSIRNFLIELDRSSPSSFVVLVVYVVIC